MPSGKILHVIRRVRDGSVALLTGLSIFVPTGALQAAQPSAAPGKLTISQRVALVREHLRQYADTSDDHVRSLQKDERVTQWPNWPNWPNWRNWGNWWNNWRNW